MTEEDKELLLRDLCGRLPYKVIVEFVSYEGEEKPWFGELSCKDLDCFIRDVGFVEIKPYLFPMSSMTEEDIYQINDILGEDFEVDKYGITDLIRNRCTSLSYLELDALFSYLNKDHFDYRGLIEKGLAIDATNLNIY